MIKKLTSRGAMALLLALILVLVAAVGPALAKGGRGGFSSGGRSSFSGSAGFSSGKGFSTGGRSFTSSGGSKSSVSAPAAVDGGRSFTGTGLGGAGNGATQTAPSAGSSYGRGYTINRDSFSTPRTGTPPTLYQDQRSTRQDYSTDRTGYTSGRQSYTGTWDRAAYTQYDRYPRRPPVGIYGSPPQPPWYYHNYYWGLPWWMHLLFQPNYYYTPWGYHFFAPRILTWLMLLGAGGLGVYWLVRRLRRV
ncbi:hypothetical protein GFC01_15545 [Desulfofundulus thermobenzoicus]|uniref:Uncharacterized protein n=1 Tax=Desulfofundulus thermobenzoicus TaxID=29376 RepID=A0A6N7IWW0_9FIRM|nr:hypothetical protein [Desulfofundulus thermobenzoicus]MQL53648.1 hypothetical protein [Desulfofundulus thermobenzoicus]